MLRYIKRHYHWVIAALVFLEMIIFGGLLNSASIYINPISKSLGVSTTAYSVAMMPYTISCFIGTSFSGFFFNRFGYKKSAIVSLIMICGSLVMTATAQNLVVFSISKIIFGMGYGACFTAGAVRVVKDWFKKHQGLILGAVSMSTGFGGSLMTTILTDTIEKSGWRAANFLAAALIGGVILLYLLLKDRPEQLGLQPYGADQPQKAAKKLVQYHEDPSESSKKPMARPLFWLMCLCVVGNCVSTYTTSSFLYPHFQSVGYSAYQAAKYQSTFMLALAFVKLGAGYLHDRFGVKPVMIGCMVAGIIGQLTLGLTTDPVISMIAVVLFSGSLCMTTIMIPLIAAPLFGHKACLQLNGIFLGLSSLSAIFANPISSMCYDVYGVYGPVFRIMPIINTVILITYLFMFAATRKKTK